jgi:uncharacterized protein YfaQ (DUF2300 family)
MRSRSLRPRPRAPHWLAPALSLGLAAAQAAAWTEPAEGELQLAWLDRAGQWQSAVLGRDGRPLARPAPQADAQVPLGSLWKLAAYARLHDTDAREPPYTCRGHDREEVYCCTPGTRVARGAALWQSCGLYFAPSRVGWLTASGDPGRTLAGRPDALQALADPARLGPALSVPLGEWLRWLADWPADTRSAIQEDLAGYWLQGPGREVLGAVGSQLRVKTFTLERRQAGAAGMRWSGASGWTRDGTPLWWATRGSSARSVPERAAQVLAFLAARRAAGDDLPPPLLDGPCVQVRLFARYPITRLQPQPPQPGLLPAQALQVRFETGAALNIDAPRDLWWQPGPDGHPQLQARLTLEDYVARVVDREGRAEPATAAQALAVAARSYVLARGAPAQGCLAIDDSSATQRVAPRPPSAGAQDAAARTAGLVLHGGPGTPGRFHGHQAARNVLAWTLTATRARQAPQLGFDVLLREAYPDFGLRLATASGGGASSCEPLPEALAWLDAQTPRWRRALQGQPGYDTPHGLQVCRLQDGRAHALRATGRLYARGVQSLEQRLELTHEYLHLAFSGHPRSLDEDFIEQTARRLLGVQ